MLFCFTGCVFVGDCDFCVDYLSSLDSNEVATERTCSPNDGMIQSISSHVQELSLVSSLLILLVLWRPRTLGSRHRLYFFLRINTLKFRIWRHVCLLNQCGVTAPTCLHSNPVFHLFHVQSLYVSGRCRCFARLLSVVSSWRDICVVELVFIFSPHSPKFLVRLACCIAWSVGLYFFYQYESNEVDKHGWQ